jgi:TolB protein
MDDASWSPDNLHIVVSEGERLFVTDTLGVDTAWITPSGSSAITPDWSPSGTWIAYVKVPPGNYGNLWLIHPDGSGDHQIVVSAAFPAWTRDGARIGFTRVGNGETALWSVDALGQGLMRLTSPTH